MKSEKKANIILYLIAVVLILVLVLGLLCINKASEFKMLITASKLAKENNYTYKVYEKDSVTPIYTLQFLNKKYRVTEKNEPGFVEGDLNKKEVIHVIPKDKIYAAIDKKEEQLKYFPTFVDKKHTFLDMFKKNVEKKKVNGEEVIIYTFKDKDKIKTYTIETKGNTLREYKETDLSGKELKCYRYEIILKNVEEYDVEPINRNEFEVKTTEDFEKKKNELQEEIKEQENKKENEHQDEEKENEADKENKENK